jgi:hypothetical protein
MKLKLMAVLLLAAGSALAQFSVGIRIGAPPPMRVVRVHPRTPGPDYTWVNGYWYPENNRYQWHAGYWTRPPYAGARWVEPRHDGQEYYQGYWEGERGPVAHDHAWDKGRGHSRDYDRKQDHRDR